MSEQHITEDNQQHTIGLIKNLGVKIEKIQFQLVEFIDKTKPRVCRVFNAIWIMVV